jgi:hypothetical protein
VFGKESCQYLCLEYLCLKILYLLVFGILKLSIEFYMQYLCLEKNSICRTMSLNSLIRMVLASSTSERGIAEFFVTQVIDPKEEFHFE